MKRATNSNEVAKETQYLYDGVRRRWLPGVTSECSSEREPIKLLACTLSALSAVVWVRAHFLSLLGTRHIATAAPYITVCI